MAANSKVIREYFSDASFSKRPDILRHVSEYQLCLAFASDSAKNNGDFIPGWDKGVTPNVIEQFKEKCRHSKLPVKVLVSIGSYPFNVGVPADDWVFEAKKSLQSIINNYHLDGIDVSYTSIECDPAMFLYCFKNLISDLNKEAVCMASLAITDATNDQFYLPLYQEIRGTGWIKTIVFQCFVGFNPASDSPVTSLVTKVSDIAVQYDCVKYQLKLLPGYSAIAEDWDNVSPLVFFFAVNSLVQGHTVNGASNKIISDTRASFPPKWIPELLSLAAPHVAGGPN